MLKIVRLYEILQKTAFWPIYAYYNLKSAFWPLLQIKRLR